MSTHERINKRLDYFQIDQDSISVLQKHYAALMKVMPNVLDDFYEYLTKNEHSKDKFQGQNIEQLKKLQSAHWGQLFQGEITQNTLNKCEEIGRIHERVGITPMLYMGGYAFVSRQLVKYIMKQCGKDQTKCIALLQAVNTVLLLDMELALTSYSRSSNQTESSSFADTLLDKNVDLSIAVNEVSIGNARMMTSLNGVSTQVQSVAAAIEEMATGIGSISTNSEAVVEGAMSAQSETTSGKDIIQETAQNMRQISEAVNHSVNRVQALVKTSDEIAGMVGSIEKIASQTNLLALNATIEAARAGDAGKGFAVVANEVKNLANQTQKATETITENISSLMGEIDGIVDAMDNGAKAVAKGEETMDAAVSSMDHIAQTIGDTTDRMQEISSVLVQQRAVANDVSNSVGEIVTATGHNVQSIEGSIQATEQVVGLMTEQIAKLAEFDIPKKSIRIAKSDHIIWKKRLADMMAGMTSLDPDELASHLHCRLGKWYYGPEAEALKNNPIYKELEPPHKVVHDCGIEAARRYKAGDHDGALEMVEQVEVASKEVVRLLDELIAQ
jgi:methyl-accepting chemotaxis protein